MRFQNLTITLTLSCLFIFAICTLLTISFAPITTAHNDGQEEDTDSSYDEDIDTYGSASVGSLTYTGSAVESNHSVSCTYYVEGKTATCTAKYGMELKEVLEDRGRVWESRVAHDDGGAAGETAENHGSQQYFHSDTLSAAATLRDDTDYILYAYTSLTVSTKHGGGFWAAHAHKHF